MQQEVANTQPCIHVCVCLIKFSEWWSSTVNQTWQNDLVTAVTVTLHKHTHTHTKPIHICIHTKTPQSCSHPKLVAYAQPPIIHSFHLVTTVTHTNTYLYSHRLSSHILLFSFITWKNKKQTYMTKIRFLMFFCLFYGRMATTHVKTWLLAAWCPVLATWHVQHNQSGYWDH